MSISTSIQPEFDSEMAATREILACVPHDRADWKPHEKSYTFEQLALHISNLPTWVGIAFSKDSFDMNPPEGDSSPQRSFTTTENLLAEFDRNVSKARNILVSLNNDAFFANWTLLNGGLEVFTLPKLAVVRSFVLNHVIHHRAQLGLYLRLNDIPVPRTYGPTADFPTFE